MAARLTHVFTRAVTDVLTAAGGVVGHYVTEPAASTGAEMTAVSATAERGAKLLRLGTAELGTSVEAAEGRYDVALESVGGTRLPAALARPALGGRLVWFGQASRESGTLDFFDSFAGRRKVRGNAVLTVA